MKIVTSTELHINSLVRWRYLIGLLFVSQFITLDWLKPPEYTYWIAISSLVQIGFLNFQQHTHKDLFLQFLLNCILRTLRLEQLIFLNNRSLLRWILIHIKSFRCSQYIPSMTNPIPREPSTVNLYTKCKWCLTRYSISKILDRIHFISYSTPISLLASRMPTYSQDSKFTLTDLEIHAFFHNIFIKTEGYQYRSTFKKHCIELFKAI